MSTVREHLGLLWLSRRALMTSNPQYDKAWADQAALFVGAHLNELIELAGGAEIEGWVKERAPEIPTDFPFTASPASTPEASQQAAADEPLCPACQGSGEGLMTEGAGPDAYEVPCACPYCGCSGGLLDEYNGLVALLTAEREKYLNACGKLFHASHVPRQAAAVAAPSVLPAELSNAFITLESSGGEGRTIVLKFNQRDDAYVVHDFLLKGGGKEWNVSTTGAATTSEDARDAALEEAALAAEKVQDDYTESQGGKWPELRDDAATGAGDCATAIRALKSGATQQEGGK